MGTAKPPAKRDGDAHSQRGEVMAALAGHYLPFLNMGECRLLVRVVDQLYFRWGNEPRMLTAKFLRTGVLPDGTRKFADIGLNERNFRAAQQGIDTKWPGLIGRWTTYDEQSRPIYWWSFNAQMFLTCPMPGQPSNAETQMAIRPVASNLPPRSLETDPPGRQRPTPPAASDLPPRSPATALNTGYKSGLEIRTEIHLATSPLEAGPSDFKTAFSLSGNETSENSSTPPADIADKIASVRAAADKAASGRADSRATKAKAIRAKPVSQLRQGEFIRAWAAAVANHHPNTPIPILTAVEGKMAKKLLSEWRDENGDLFDLIDFSVREWAGLMGNQFKWMKGFKPDLPDLGFFCRQQANFQKAYAAGRHYAMADDKRTELQRLMAEGKSEAQAQAILDERARAPHVRQRRAPGPEAPAWTNPNWKGRKAQ